MENKRGGKRVGAGRKKLSYATKSIKVTLPSDLAPLLKKLGGSKWIASQIQAAMENV